MSFSSQVREELAKHIPKSRHCQLAELAAMIAFEGRVWSSENETLQEKYNKLVELLFDENQLAPEELVEKLFSSIKMWDEKKKIPVITSRVDGLLLQQTCCKRAYIRGAFLVGGSISDPNKSYHFEIVCRTKEQAAQLAEAMNSFDVDAKIVKRTKYYVVYLKEGSHIVDMLNVMEAHVSLMDLENVRILKEMRNSVNRKVNCETANISKTVKSAHKQIEDITLIMNTQGLDSLPANLKEMAEVRLANPEESLKELGELLSPPVGKSGVNHRLQKISEIAESIRGKEK